MVSNLCTEFLYWEFLGFVNLAVSVVVYRFTQLERRQKIATQYELSTRPARTPVISFPSSFTYLSLFTGMLNAAGGFLRFQRIHFLDIPTIPWLHETLKGRISDELMKLLEAEWLVALNDWTSLFLAVTFFMAAGFNFATVRQLILRDRWERETLLPGRPHRTTPSISSNSSWHAHLTEDKLANGPVSGDATVAFHAMAVDAEGKSFAVFSNAQQLRAKRV